MRLRKAELTDLPSMLEACRTLHSKGWPGVFDEAKTLKVLEGIVIGNLAENIAFICEEGEDMAGVAVLTTFLPAFSDDLFVCELALFVDKRYPKAIVYLVDAAIEWARRIDAKGITLGLRREQKDWHGLKPCETVYIKELR